MVKFFENFIFLFSIFICSCLVYISFYNVYQTDDYVLAYNTLTYGNPLKGLSEIYSHWSGRYFSFLIASSNSLIFSNSQIIPKITPILYLIFFIFSVSLNLNLYFGLRRLELFKKSVILFFIYILSLSSLSENFFWFTGSQVYFLPIILSFFLAYFLGKYNKGRVKIYSYLSLITIFLIIGCNEIISIIWTGIALLLVLLKKDKFSKTFFAITILSVIISFSAPGNYIRLDPVEEKIHIKLLKYTGIATLNGIFIAFKLLFIVPLFLFIFKDELEKTKRHFNKSYFKFIFIIQVITLIFTGILLLPSERVLDNLIFFSLIITSFYFSYIFKKIPAYLSVLMLMIFTLPPLYLSPQKSIYFKINYNLRNILVDTFKNNLNFYDEEMKKRHEILKKTPLKNISLKPILHKPSALYFEEIGTLKEKNYINDQLEKYYNKENIVLEK